MVQRLAAALFFSHFSGFMAVGHGATAQDASAFTFVVAPFLDAGATAYSVRNSSGLQHSTVSATTAIQYAIDALPFHGGTIFLKAGEYVLDSTVTIDRSSVEIRGENKGGDLFFASDSFYNGFGNKTATTIVAAGDFDAFAIGTSPVCRNTAAAPSVSKGTAPRTHTGSHCLILGISLANLGISGVQSDAALNRTWHTGGAGIRVEKADTIRLDNIDIRRKAWGVRLGQNTTQFPHFDYDHVIDVLTINNLYLAYNVQGMYSDGWVSNVRIKNLFCYLNQKSCIYAEAKYDWDVDGVMSQGDGLFGTSSRDAQIYISTRQDFTMSHVTIAGENAASTAPLIFVELNVAADETGEWYRAKVKLQDLVLFATLTDAVYATGHGHLDIVNIHAGSTGNQAFYGGSGDIGRYCVNANGPDTSVFVAGGFCQSNSTELHRSQWMHNVTRVSDVRGVSPVGSIPAAFSTEPPYRVGPGGGSTASPFPAAGRVYTAHGANLIFSVKADADKANKATLHDPSGEVYQVGVVGLLHVPVGWGVSFDTTNPVLVGGD